MVRRIAAGWWAAAFFLASCLSNQGDLHGKRYAVTRKQSVQRHPDAACLLPLCEEFVGRMLSLIVAKLFDLLVDPPLVPERIDDLSVTSSPEHVLHRHTHARAGSHRALDNVVRIVHKESDAHAGSSERHRRLTGPA